MSEETKLNAKQIKDIIIKIVGEVKPIGKSEVDSVRLENLKLLGDVFRLLHEEITNVQYYNNNAPEHSVLLASRMAYQILEDTTTDWAWDYFHERGEFSNESYW